MLNWKIIKFLSAYMPNHFAAGKITVTESANYLVELDFTPDEDGVSLTLDAPCGAGVCGGEKDGFDTTVVPNGFVITATMNTQYRKIKWTAER